MEDVKKDEWINEKEAEEEIKKKLDRIREIEDNIKTEVEDTRGKEEDEDIDTNIEGVEGLNLDNVNQEKESENSEGESEEISDSSENSEEDKEEKNEGPTVYDFEDEYK